MPWFVYIQNEKLFHTEFTSSSDIPDNDVKTNIQLLQTIHITTILQ